MAEDRFTELLGKKLSGEITTNELKEFSSAVANNESYSKEYESLKTYWQEDEKSYDTIGVIFEKIKEKTGIREIEDQKVVQLNLKKRKFSWIQKIAAVLFVLVLSAGIYQFFLSGSLWSKSSSIAWEKLETPSRLIRKVTLCDGTQITLNSESTLKYPKTFTGATREVYLTGEAYFDVASDHKHPFILHTEKMDIRVLGTAFNVRSYTNDRSKEATLLRGKIQVTFRDNPAEKVILKPTDKIVIKDSSYVVTSQTYYNHSDGQIIETLWMNNKLAFRNESFESLANSLSRKYGVKMVFTNNSLRDLQFSGEFEKENINQALLSLQIVTPFHYKLKGDSVYLY